MKATSLGILAVLTTAITACGGSSTDSFTEDDFEVCYYAHGFEAEGVYEHAADATDKDLLEIASAIAPGSSGAADQKAMLDLNELCENAGYDYAKDSRYGRESAKTAELKAAAASRAAQDEAEKAAEAEQKRQDEAEETARAERAAQVKPGAPGWVSSEGWRSESDCVWDQGYEPDCWPLQPEEGLLTCEGPGAVFITDTEGYGDPITKQAAELMKDDDFRAEHPGWLTGDPGSTEPAVISGLLKVRGLDTIEGPWPVDALLRKAGLSAC